MTTLYRLSFAHEAVVIDLHRQQFEKVTQPFKSEVDEKFARGLLKGYRGLEESKIRARFIANAFGRSVSIIHDDQWNGYPHEYGIVQPEPQPTLPN